MKRARQPRKEPATGGTFQKAEANLKTGTIVPKSAQLEPAEKAANLPVSKKQLEPAPKKSPIGDIPAPAPTEPAGAPNPPEQPQLPHNVRWQTEESYQRWVKSDPVTREIYRRRRRSYIFD